MDINPEISNWVLEFLLKQPLEDGVLNSLLRSLPLSDNNAHLKKMILLRKIDSDLSGSWISESTLEVFEEIEFQQGREAVSDAMKRAYCAVAVECTVQPLAGNGDGGTDSRKFKFFELVKRVWKGRIGRLEKMVEKGGLGSDELWRWKEEMEAAVWEDSVFEGVVKKSEGVHAVEAVRAYMREEKEKMGPPFLELVANSVKNDEARPGVVTGKEGQPASVGGVSSVVMEVESDISDDGQLQSSDQPVSHISSAHRKSSCKTTHMNDSGDDDQLQSSDQPVSPISSARRKSSRKTTRMSDIGDDEMVQFSDQPVSPISSARRKSSRKTTHMSDSGDDDQLQSSDQPVSPISSACRKISRKPTRTSDIDGQSVRRRNGRKSACMMNFNLKTKGKVKVHFDSLLDASGPNKRNTDNFISYLGFLGRKLVSILPNSWMDVSGDNKEHIWQGILDKFEFFFLEDQNEVEFSLVNVKKQNKFKNKWVSYVGRRWASFKTYLTRNYIYGKRKGQLPYEDDYPFLDADTWNAFVASRLTEEHKAKREQAQKANSHNKCPHRCSRGGYKLLKQKIMEEKYKARQEASEDPLDVIPPPSPPSRHEVWKRARISADGKYTTPEASIIGEKIGNSQPKNLDPKPQSEPETSVDVIKLLWVASADITEPKYICMESGIVGEKTDQGVHVCQDDIMGLLLTRQISAAAMQFYNKYLHNVLKLSGRTDKYGLMSPLTIKNHAINEEIGVILRKRIAEGDFECFLVPIYEDHWQLMVLCPKYNVVTWFCPMGKKQKRKLSEKIETAFEAYQVTKGKRTYKSKKPQWVYPKCYLQKGSAIEACGFFVMRLMLEIIKLDIVNSFEKALDPKEFYSKDSIDVVRRCWAKCFLKVISR